MYMCVLSRVWLSVTLGSPPGSSLKGISQARILEWVVMPSSRGSSQPRNQTHTYPSLLHCRWILYCWATRDAQCCPYIRQNLDTGIHMGDSLLRRRVTQSLPSSSFGIPHTHASVLIQGKIWIQACMEGTIWRWRQRSLLLLKWPGLCHFCYSSPEELI